MVLEREPAKLSDDIKRYLAQELLDELRKGRWRLVAIDDTYTPSRGPIKDSSGRGPIGQGTSSPKGSIYAIAFTVERVYELGLDERQYVVLEATHYERWSKRHMTGHSAELERLLWNRRTVFQVATSGYGTTLRPCTRLRVSAEEGAALMSLFDLCHVLPAVP